MYDIAVIIVNYNVEFFLRQCLESITSSAGNLRVQIIVVDNASVDGSMAMLRQEFPAVTRIENKENVGFSKANNQGILAADAKYVLLLNPDTLIEEATLITCYTAAENDPTIGAIGVRMQDGAGNYLPESKRGFPTAIASFWKFTGIYKFFPKSKSINAYYAGHLGEYEAGNVEVLCGAFMFMPTAVVKEVNLLDEDYFMYGEDIDLSYCIGKAGYKIFYLPTTSIIHYKGESTKRHSRKYQTAFYGAMQIFLRKHFADSSAITLFVLKTVISLIGLLSFLKYKFAKVARLCFDIGFACLLSFATVRLWGNYYYGDAHYFQSSSYVPILGICVSLLALLNYGIGHYDIDGKRSRYLPSSLLYLFLVLVVYALLPAELRFSRPLIIAAVLLASLTMYYTRVLYNRLLGLSKQYDIKSNRRIVLIGSVPSLVSIKNMLINKPNASIVGSVAPSDKYYNSEYHVANINRIDSVIQVMDANELLFCSSDMSMSDIFRTMARLGGKLNYRIASLENKSVLGSDNKNIQGQWYTETLNFTITSPSNIRLKRTFDIIAVLSSWLLFPYFLLRSSLTRMALKKSLSVLLGKATWFGYPNATNLPDSKPSIFMVGDFEEEENVEQRIFKYCTEYSIWYDVSLWLNAIANG